MRYDWSKIPKEGKMELDLTKRVRICAGNGPNSGREFYPSTLRDGDMVAGFIEGIAHVGCLLRISGLENIPEPVKHTAHVHMTDTGDPHLCNGCTSGAHSKDAKITVWRDEYGRTRVEVME